MDAALQEKIRLGMILEGCVGAALESTKYAFVAHPNYAQFAMTPDYMIPDESNPRFVVEVTHAEVWNSVRMKILRYFQAISDAKLHFGIDVVSVSILLGDPEKSIPINNLRALQSLFDVNISPRNECTSPSERRILAMLEKAARGLAAAVDFDETQSAVNRLKVAHDDAIRILGRLIESKLENATAGISQTMLWKREIERERAATKSSPVFPDEPSYKPRIIESLYLEDEQFELLRRKGESSADEDLRMHAEKVGIGTVTRSIRGETLVLTPKFKEFLFQDGAGDMRSAVAQKLQNDLIVSGFFSDIQSDVRRKKMAQEFLDAAKKPDSGLLAALEENYFNDSFAGIRHGRCWLADFFPLSVGESHNAFTRRIVADPDYPSSLQNPFANIVIKSPRLGRKDKITETFLIPAVRAFRKACQELSTNLDVVTISLLTDRLLTHRLQASIKLHKLNPLHLLFSAKCEALGLRYEYRGCENIISDFAGAKGGVSSFRAFRVSGKGRIVLVALIYVDDYGGLDKSKEWAARGRSAWHRLKDGEIRDSEVDGLLFIADGMWKPEALERLHRAGWMVVRPSGLEKALRELCL